METSQGSGFMFLGLPRCIRPKQPSKIPTTYKCECGFDGSPRAITAHYHETGHHPTGDVVLAVKARLRRIARENEVARAHIGFTAAESETLFALLNCLTLPVRIPSRPCTECGKLTKDKLGDRPLCAKHTVKHSDAMLSLYAELLSDDDD